MHVSSIAIQCFSLSPPPPPAQIFSFSSTEWLRTATDTLPQTYKCKKTPEARLYLSFVPTLLGCKDWKQSSPLLRHGRAVIVVLAVLSRGGAPGIPCTECREAGSKTQPKLRATHKLLEQINKREVILVIPILQSEKQDPQVVAPKVPTKQAQELSPELVGPSQLCWPKESSVSHETAPASPVCGCYSLLALRRAPGLAGRQVCGRSAAAQGSSQRVPATSGSSLKSPQPGEGRYLPNGCRQGQSSGGTVLCVQSSHQVPLKESMGASPVPSRVKSAAVCHQFAQCSQTLQLNLSRWLPSSPAPARRCWLH